MSDQDKCPECEGVIGNAATCNSVCKGAKALIELLSAEQGKQEPVAWENPEHLAEQLGAMLADGSTVCPLCGDNFVHKHSPFELLIYRNGVKYGRSLYAAPTPDALLAAELAGTVLVPREPTFEQVSNGELAILKVMHPDETNFASSRQGRACAERCYRAMLAAEIKRREGK